MLKTTPYEGSIPDGLSVGKSIFIRFRTNDACQRFEFNLENPNGISFHFNPRLDSGTVVMNSSANNLWANEEIDNNCPFHANRLYGIQIKVEQNYYAIYLTGILFNNFELIKNLL